MTTAADTVASPTAAAQPLTAASPSVTNMSTTADDDLSLVAAMYGLYFQCFIDKVTILPPLPFALAGFYA